MNKKIVSVLVGILVIGIVSAGLVGYLSNMVSGTVTVEGPVFYATGEHIEGDVPTVIYGMSTNQPSEDTLEFKLTNGNVIIFATNSLEVDSFYSPRFDFNIKTKTNIKGNDLFLEVWVLDKDYKYIQKLCDEIKITVGATVSYTNYPASCEFNSPLTLSEGDRFGLKISGSGVDSWYLIKAQEGEDEHTTLMKVSAT